MYLAQIVGGPGDWKDWIVWVLAVWVTTGLPLVHLTVLAWHAVRRGEADPAVAGGPAPGLTLTFIVPVYNDAPTVARCLESILAQSREADAVIVVNDGSIDGTAAVLGPYEARGVTVIHFAGNRGKTRALEAGLAHVRTDLVSITDADSVVDREYVREITRSFRDPGVVAAGGAVESLPGTWITAARQIEYMLSMNLVRAAEDRMNSILVLSGASTTYRAAVLRGLGFQHDTIAEDVDLTFRLRKTGGRMVMNLRAKVYTSDPPTIRAYFHQMLRWHTDFWLGVRKHRDVFGRRLFGLVELPMTVVNAVASSVLYLALPLYFVLFQPAGLVVFVVAGSTMDLLLATVAHRRYRRRDVYWSVLSRYPTRCAGRLSFLIAMTRVLAGRPDMRWKRPALGYRDA